MDLSNWQIVMLLGAFIVVLSIGLPMRRKESANSGSEDASSDIAQIQDSLEQFMSAMEADNQEMLNTVMKAQQELRSELSERDRKISMLEETLRGLEGRLGRAEGRLEERTYSAANRTPEYQLGDTSAIPGMVSKQLAEPESEPPIRERYAELFDLYAQGKSVDVIAKKTSMNKGEVMLILQLAKQEEERRA